LTLNYFLFSESCRVMLYSVAQIGDVCIGISKTLRATESVKWGKVLENFMWNLFPVSKLNYLSSFSGKLGKCLRLQQLP